MNLFTLVATLGLDTSDFSKNIGSAVDQGKKLGSGLTKVLGIAGKTAAAVAVTTTAAYVSVVKKSADAVSELEQNIGGAEAVWGHMNSSMLRLAEDSYKSMALSTSDFLSFANQIGGVLNGLGFDEAQAFSMTAAGLQRMADVASVMGHTAEEGAQAFMGMLRGETQSLEKFGVVMSENAIQAWMVEKGMTKTFRKLSENEKNLIRFNMLMDQTAYAQGNVVKESETLAGAAAMMKASWTNLLDGSGSPDEFADQLVNYADVYMNVLSEVAPRIAKSIGVVFENIGQRTRAWLDSVGGIGGALSKGLDWTLGKLDLPSASTIVQQVSDWWTGLEGENVYEKIKEAISIGINKVDVPPLDQVIENITTWWRDTAVPAIETAMSTYAEEFAIPLIADLLNLSDEDAEALLTAYQEFFGSIGELASTVVDLIGEIVTAIGNLFSSSSGDYDGSGIGKALTKLVEGFTAVTGAANSALTAVKDFFAYFNGRSTAPAGTSGAGGLLVNAVDRASGDHGSTFGQQAGQWFEGVWNDTLHQLGVPGHATGLDFVPYDDYFARLHRGEMVLTKLEADRYRNGGFDGNNATNISVVNQINSVAQNPADIAFATQQSIRTLRFNY